MSKISISLLHESELEEAEQLCRLAFGTFLKLPDPMQFGDGAQYAPRSLRDPNSAFGASLDDKLIGLAIAINWGSLSGFGPLVVHPDYWNQGIASLLMQSALLKFQDWHSKHISFCTHPSSPLHLHFYGKFGFSPRFLIALMSKSIVRDLRSQSAHRYSQLTPLQQKQALDAIYQLTDQLFEGLNWRDEIVFVNKRCLGDTLLLWNDTGLLGFAMCHYGTGSEAPRNTCYVKLGAMRAGSTDSEFEQLLDECEIFTAQLGLSSLNIGVDTALTDAYRMMLARKFRIISLFVSMHKPNSHLYSRRDVYIINDRR